MKYQTGEKTLKIIGKRLGVTPTMINRLHNSAIEKTRTLTYNKPLEFFTPEEDQEFFNFIDICRSEALYKFVDLFKKADLDIYDFLLLLKKQQFITNNDIKLMSEQEIESLVLVKELIKENELEKIKSLLDEDINQDDSILLTYQNIISRVAFPNKKRGRPRKEI